MCFKKSPILILPSIEGHTPRLERCELEIVDAQTAHIVCLKAARADLVLRLTARGQSEQRQGQPGRHIGKWGLFLKRKVSLVNNKRKKTGQWKGEGVGRMRQRGVQFAGLSSRGS